MERVPCCLPLLLLALLAGCQGMPAWMQPQQPQTKQAAPEPKVVAASQPTSKPTDAPDELLNPIRDWAAKMAAKAAARRGSAKSDDARDEAQLAADTDPEGGDGAGRLPPREPERIISSTGRGSRRSESAGTNADLDIEPLAGQKPEPVAAVPSSQPTTAPIAPTVASKPPTVSGVTARSERDFAIQRRAGQPDATALNSPEKATVLPATLRELLDELPEDATGGDLRGQIVQRILHAAAGDADKARKPLALATREQQTVCGRFVDAVLALREVNGGRPDDELASVLAPLAELRESLAAIVDLKLPTIEVCRAVRGFGQYEAMTPTFVAGRDNEFVLYAEVSDFVSERGEDGWYKSVFALKVAVLSRAGDVVQEVAAPEMVDRCRTRRQDCFVSPLVRLPRTLSPGEYVVKVTISDRIGEKVAERQTTIRVVDR
ncbi:MAG: hypothetical protein ACKVS9_13110 [Phycisphaerae bacterium]